MIKRKRKPEEIDKHENKILFSKYKRSSEKNLLPIDKMNNIANA